MLFFVWIISSIVLFFLIELHLSYAEKLLGNGLGSGYWIGWEISWELFLSVAVFFISSLLFTKITSTKIKTHHRFIVAYLLPIILSITVFNSIPQNYYKTFFDGGINTLENIIVNTTYLVCLAMAISHIFWLKQEVDFYQKEKTHFAITTLLVIINFLLVSLWGFAELVRGM